LGATDINIALAVSSVINAVAVVASVFVGGTAAFFAWKATKTSEKSLRWDKRHWRVMRVYQQCDELGSLIGLYWLDRPTTETVVDTTYRAYRILYLLNMIELSCEEDDVHVGQHTGEIKRIATPPDFEKGTLDKWKADSTKFRECNQALHKIKEAMAQAATIEP